MIVKPGRQWVPQVLTAPFSERAFHTTVFYPDDTAMLVLGGQNSTGSSMNDVWASTDKGRPGPALRLQALA